MTKKKSTKKTKETIKNELKDIDFNSLEKVDQKESLKGEKTLYFGYEIRVILFIISFIILLIGGGYFLSKSVNFYDEVHINYNEKSDASYSVLLKENQFYEGVELNENMSYIASLIDKVNTNFKYSFTSDSKIKGEFNYRIIAELIIKNADTKKQFYKKEYVLKEEKITTVEDKDVFYLNEDIVIDYDYYNEIANSFKATYGVNSESNLKVSLEVNDIIKANEEDEGTKNHNNVSINIPLSEKAISIKIKANDINKSSKLLSSSKLDITNVMYMIIGLICLVIACIMFIDTTRILTKLQGKSNKYDKEVKRLLKEYDRLIVNVTKMPDLTELKKTTIEEFNELLDLRDNFNEPIRFLEVSQHLKCHFFLIHNNEIFIYTVKNIDLENK